MRVSDIFDRAFGGGVRRPMITIVGDRAVLIENCRRLLECSDIKCSVLSAGYLVEVWGTELTASGYAGGSASIGGRIQTVNIERRKGGAAE